MPAPVNTMNKIPVLTNLLVSLSGSVLFAQAPPPAATPPLATPPPLAAPPVATTPAEPAEPIDMKIVGYLIGADLGQKLHINGVEVNLDDVVAGIKDGLTGTELKYPLEQRQKIMTAFQNDLRAKVEKKQAELAKKNAKLSEDFLAENGKHQGIVTTASGLQYQIIKEGDGPKPAATDKVKAIYKGELTNGTVFDDSHGQPREFPLASVVKGWQEALPLMPTGSKWKLFIPPSLGYGPLQRGPVIEPNSVLVFDIELVEVIKGPPPGTLTPGMPAAGTPPVGVIPPGVVPVNPNVPPRKPVVAVTPPVSISPSNKDDAPAPKPDDKKKE